MHRQSNRDGCRCDEAARMRLHGKRPAHSRRSEQERFEMSGPCWPRFCGTKKGPPRRAAQVREETPKVGGNTARTAGRCCTAQVMLQCTMMEVGRWSQGR